ncbi:hypothetical protein NKF06_14065 [Haloferax sp. AB510]|uniref:hypothetical protein n=1 Tax=Haloferax sp. AB510 TaxID=2934172 RepID=UPI00209BF024|nr:hypothetical protein [Haloferax sp. AB510]MCO8267679.1 hypothetical protein [Haloferax sp. AB510]
MSPPLSRRQLLSRSSAVGTVALAGCLGVVTGNEDQRCAPGYRDVGDAFTKRSIVNYLRYASLTVPQSVSLGGTLIARLTNESADSLTTFGKSRYMIQQLGPDGKWRNSIGVAEEHEWSSSHRILAPGEELQWEMRLRANEFSGPYQRCTTHGPATYRFIYWGFSEHDAGIALAAPFEIVE